MGNGQYVELDKSCQGLTQALRIQMLELMVQ